MRKRFSLFIVMGLICALLLAACSSGGQDTPVPTQEAAIVNGTLEGGDDSLGSDINLKDINIEMQGENTVITMYFLNGSRIAGVDESKISAVPSYKVTQLPAPFRLQVDLKIGFWDYADNNETYNNSIIYGLFNTAHSDSDEVSIFFQLNEDVQTTVKEDSDKLVITMSPKPSVAESAFFVGLNAYEAYEQNLVPQDIGMTPTMCDGLTDLMLISKPLKDEASANKLAEEVNLKIAGAVPAKQAYVFQMSTDALPQYNKSMDAESVKEEPVMMKDGVATSLAVMVENGRYLCTMADGRILYARSYVPDSTEDTEQVLKEKLWIIETNGKKTQLELPYFYSVEKAAASADGRYIAILDSGIENKVLYVYDTQEGMLRNLGEEGLGRLTTPFAWDPEQPVIYAMTGEDSLQLKKYDVTQPGAVEGVEEQPGADSKIELAGGKVYFADKSANDGAGMIYSVDIASQERKEITQGVDFTISNDGGYLAAVVPVKNEEDPEALSYAVTIKNLTTEAEPVEVISNVSVESLGFGADNNTLYITTPDYEGVTEEYPFALLRYVLSTQQFAPVEFSKTSRIIPGVNAGEVYVIDYFSQNGNSFYVTYIDQEK